MYFVTYCLNYKINSRILTMLSRYTFAGRNIFRLLLAVRKLGPQSIKIFFIY